MYVPAIRRFVPLAAWIVTVFCLICVAGRIIAYGYLPPDDALRHAAKVISGKPWSEILVMRDGFILDPHPGWHAMLGVIHRLIGGDVETLVVLPVAGLMVCFSLAALMWLRRPEAWLGALLAANVFSPTFIGRISLGRPFLFTMCVYIILLVMWSRLSRPSPGRRELITTVILIAAAAWMHGSFYQLLLPAVGLFLAGRWRPRFGIPRFGPSAVFWAHR